MKKIIFTITLLVFPAMALASMKQANGIVPKNAIYLGAKEAQALNELASSKKGLSEAYTVTFRCNNYLRMPQSKGKSTNCIATSIIPAVQ